MDIFTQVVVVIGRVTPSSVNMLGTGFLVSSDGKVVTTRHVVGDSDAGLVVLMPHINNINAYQDTSDNSCQFIEAQISEIDPIKDLAILTTTIRHTLPLPSIGSFDNISVGEKVGIFGFPHCVEGRRVLTYQEAEVGAKALLQASGINSKHAIINIQSRPGQSGSLVFSSRLNSIVGVLIGAYAPEGGGISLGGINPRELHQTTQCVSAEYIREML